LKIFRYCIKKVCCWFWWTKRCNIWVRPISISQSKWQCAEDWRSGHIDPPKTEWPRASS